jgi:hypothetical protein
MENSTFKTKMNQSTHYDSHDPLRTPDCQKGKEANDELLQDRSPIVAVSSEICDWIPAVAAARC